MKITKEIFEQQRSPRFGTSNPERMQMAFWEWMIRGAMGPYHARQTFGVSWSCGDSPIWTFDRMGATRTALPDGRTVYVGGEHEDFYDPDFYIYNDVVVFTPGGQIEIYGYPKETFPPTDFHTATLLGEELIVIGSVGYQGERIFGKTPVYGLDLKDYSIRGIKTSGKMPGWISRHVAAVAGSDAIVVRGGRIFDSDQKYLRNLEEYALDLRNASWRRITDRNWRQFVVCQRDGNAFAVQPKMLGVEDLVPGSAERAQVQPSEYRAVRILVQGVPVLLEIGVASVEIVIEGDLHDEACAEFGEAIRRNSQTLLERECILREL